MATTKAQQLIDLVDIAYANGSSKLMSSGSMARSSKSLIGVAHRELANLSGVSLRTIQRWAKGDVANPKNYNKLEGAVSKLDPRIRADMQNAADALRNTKGKRYKETVARMKHDYPYARKKLDNSRKDWQKQIKEGGKSKGNVWSEVISR